jgi:hypothetical protein
LLPAPQTTTTASGIAVPARSIAKQSLSTIVRRAQLSASIACSRRVTSIGRSAPAR